MLLIKSAVCALIFVSCFSSCYRMPSDDCVSTIPITNNPQIVPQKGPKMMPSIGY